MADIFISYARPSEAAAVQLASHFRALGYSVWRDDELPAHRPYADVIEERLREAKAVVVVWSAAALKSQWVRAEAEMAREARTLVQLSIDGVLPPLPFNQIQCADMNGWHNNGNAPGLQKIEASLAELLQRPGLQTTARPATSVQPTRPEQFAGRAIVAVPPAARAAGSASADAGHPDHPGEGLRADIMAALSNYIMLAILPSRDEFADYCLDITARRSQHAIRVSARLTAVASGETVWMERYDGTDSTLFELEDKATLEVAASVEACIRRRVLKQAIQTPENSDDSDALYLRGAMQVMRAEKDSFVEATALFERVIAEKPQHQHALAVAALAHLNIWMNGYLEGSESDRETALEYARRTLALSDSDPMSTGLAAATLAFVGEPMDISIALIDRILALHPTFSPAWLWSGQIRLIQGDLETALNHLETSSRLDPHMTSREFVLGARGAAEMLLGRFADASKSLREAFHLTGHNVMNNLFLAACHAHLGEQSEARAQLARAAAIAPPQRFRLPLRNPQHRALFSAGLDLAARPAETGAKP